VENLRRAVQHVAVIGPMGQATLAAASVDGLERDHLFVPPQNPPSGEKAALAPVPAAQDLGHHNGSVVRLNRERSVACQDMPFVGRERRAA